MPVRQDDAAVTLGEVYRLVKDIKTDQGEKLDSIDRQVRLTNGRTTRLEEQFTHLHQEVRDIKQACPVCASSHHGAPSVPSVPIMTPEGESLSIKVSPKMWLLIASGFTGVSVIAPKVFDWLERIFSK